MDRHTQGDVMACNMLTQGILQYYLKKRNRTQARVRNTAPVRFILPEMERGVAETRQ